MLGRWGLTLVLALLGYPATSVTASAQSQTQVQVYASGFVNPKGMAFGPDGTLYVAESGAPGDVMVPLPVNFGGEGPMGTNARISRIRPGGVREDLITGLPNIGLYGGVEMLGAASIAVIGDTHYEVAAGHMTVSPLLSRFTDDGQMTTVADVGAFNDANPPPEVNGDAVPMGNPYDLVPWNGNLYITDGNYNRVIQATPDGQLSIFQEAPDDPTTTGGAVGPDNALYIAQFGNAPYTPGSSRIDRITADGTVTQGYLTNLTTPVDVAFAPDGTMYVLQYAAEFSAEQLRYVAFGGAVLRVNPDGSTTPVVTNLVFPTHMTFGPDGALYVSNYGNEANHGEGQILRVVPGDQPARGPDVPPPDESGTYANAQPTATEDPSLQPVATIQIVEPQDVQQWGYSPKELTIQAGQAVTITNTGRISHTATASDGVFDTGLLAGGQSIVMRFDTPGVHPYFCQPHPWMQGTITVEGAGGVTATAVPGATFTQPHPPSINPWTAAGVVGLIIGAVFAAGFALRRSPRQDLLSGDAAPGAAVAPEAEERADSGSR